MQVAPWIRWLGKHVHNHPHFWIKLSQMENRIVAHELANIEAPIYITGLARSGSTLLLELLNKHPCTTSFCYEDFPFIYTPWLWSHFTRYSKPSTQLERAHKDGLSVNNKSPEAMEEILWMHAFPHCHDPKNLHLLDEKTCQAEFEQLYRHTIQKLLLAHNGKRYLAKANYHIARIPYLRKLFPDARFIIPIRNPKDHIASLIKQHQLFSTWHQKDPYVTDHLRYIGHFEFGMDRGVVNITDTHDGKQTMAAWESGKDVEGYALQWHHTYRYVHQLLEDDKHRDALLLVPFETLCKKPNATLKKVFEHVQLEACDIIETHGKTIEAPTYYEPNFTEKDLEKLFAITQKSAALFGYDLA